jgi:hypothetical protein
MQNLNYNKLMSLNPCVYRDFTNRLGQKMQFIEHPIEGDEYPIIIVFHDEELAFCSDFYDDCDFYEGSDYEPVLSDGVCMCYFEYE